MIVNCLVYRRMLYVCMVCLSCVSYVCKNGRWDGMMMFGMDLDATVMFGMERYVGGTK